MIVTPLVHQSARGHAYCTHCNNCLTVTQLTTAKTEYGNFAGWGLICTGHIPTTLNELAT